MLSLSSNTSCWWCTADPGWVTGTTYGIVAPLVLGVTSIVDEAEFDPARWIQDGGGSGPRLKCWGGTW